VRGEPLVEVARRRKEQLVRVDPDPQPLIAAEPQQPTVDPLISGDCGAGERNRFARRTTVGERPRRLRDPQDLLHRLAAGELVDQQVEVADLLHERILDLLYPHPADDPRDERDVRVESRIDEEVLESGVLCHMMLQR
jgi:hypothetical protein